MESEDILNYLKNRLQSKGMEVYLFNVEWYNDAVSNGFRLNYANGTVCAVILTIPTFFESSLLPFINENYSLTSTLPKDPVDECIFQIMRQVLSPLSDMKYKTLFDYELNPNRRPKILMQTAAHISGAAYYYQNSHLSEIDPPVTKKLFGVCLHPQYGGWFAIRSVVIFEDIINSNLKKTVPINCLETPEEIQNLLERFNGNWRDWTYRDVIKVKDRYSDLQKLYFETLPKNRLSLMPVLLKAIEN